MSRLEFATANVLATKPQYKQQLLGGKKAKKFLRNKVKTTECCSFNTFNSIVIGLIGSNLKYMDVGQVDGMLRKVFKIIYRPGRGDAEEPSNNHFANTG